MDAISMMCESGKPEILPHDVQFAKLAFMTAHGRMALADELNPYFSIILAAGREGLLDHLRRQRLSDVPAAPVPTPPEAPVVRPIWEELLEYGFGKQNIWLGRVCPFKADLFDYGRMVNARAESGLHGTFDVVWMYERPTFEFPGWKLLLDEAIRLLKQSGTLVIRTVDSGTGTLWELKSILGRMVTVDVTLLRQSKLKDGSVVSAYHIHRKFFEAYQNQNWTVGILTNGQKEDNVVQLMERFMQLRGKREVEFLIAGPHLKSKPPTMVRYVTIPHADSLPRISEKKQKLLEAATHANVALFHDRYVINNDFFVGFDKFGYDFDFISIAQNYEGGEVFPGYAGLKDRSMRWQPPMFDPHYNTLFDGHFINGGLMIFKNHLKDAVNFNPLLLHNEAEDVEMSFILKDHGVMPRMNSYASATTVGLQPSYTGTFRNVTG